MILRDSTIREQEPLATNRQREISSGVSASSVTQSQQLLYNRHYLNMTQQENNSMLLRDSLPQRLSSNVISNRIYNGGGLDQRIIKQSSEDCRRLLQQVNQIYVVQWKLF